MDPVEMECLVCHEIGEWPDGVCPNCGSDDGVSADGGMPDMGDC